MTRARNKRGEGGQLRDDIVAAAARLLDDGTERDVTLRAVAREAGISAPSIYSHFADTDTILLAVAQEAVASLDETLHAAGDSAGPADPAKRLRAVCAAYLQFAEQRPGRYRVIFGAVWNADKARERVPALAADVEKLGTGTLDFIAQCIAGCAEAGQSRSTDPAADATALWAGLHGVAQLRVAAPVFPWPPGVAERVVDHLALLD